MTQSPNKTELNVGEMPAEIWYRQESFDIRGGKFTNHFAGVEKQNGDVKYIREDLALSKYCGYKNAYQAIANGHVPSMEEAAADLVEKMKVE